MIIVEGPDGAGKSTLCEKLESHFFQQGANRMDWMAEMGISRDEMKEVPTRRYYHALREAYGPCTYIHDRLFFSSLVYGPLMQGNIQMSEEDRKTISRTILALACPIIVCLPPREIVHMNVSGEGHQMEGVREIIDDIYDGYQEVIVSQAYPFVMYYDYTGEFDQKPSYWDFDQLVIRVQHYFDRRKQRTYT